MSETSKNQDTERKKEILTHSELNAIERFFDQQLAQFWNRWRRIVITIGVSLGLLILTLFILSILFRSSFDIAPGSSNPPIDFLILSVASYTLYLVVIGAVIVGSMQVKALKLPTDIDLTASDHAVYGVMTTRARRILRNWIVGIGMIFPLLNTCILTTIGLLVGIGVTPTIYLLEVVPSSFVHLLSRLIATFGLLMFLSEWQLSVLTRVHKNKHKLGIAALPIITYIAISLLWECSAYSTSMVSEFIIPAQRIDLLLGFSVIAVISIISSFYLWRFLLEKNNPKYWWVYSGAVILGYLLTVIPFNRAPHLFQLEQFKCTISTALIGLHLGGRNNGIAPFLFDGYLTLIPFTRALLIIWQLLYYTFSYIVIFRLNNIMPRGYRGTWESE